MAKTGTTMNESKEAGVVIVNTSFWSAQNVYGTWRRTVDYHNLNEAMTPTVAAVADVFS